MKIRIRDMQSLLDFIKAMVSNGYEIKIKCIMRKYPYDFETDYFLIDIEESENE